MKKLIVCILVSSCVGHAAEKNNSNDDAIITATAQGAIKAINMDPSKRYPEALELCKKFLTDRMNNAEQAANTLQKTGSSPEETMYNSQVCLNLRNKEGEKDYYNPHTGCMYAFRNAAYALAHTVMPEKSTAEKGAYVFNTTRIRLGGKLAQAMLQEIEQKEKQSDTYPS